MPKTHIKLYPLEAAVFYATGEAQTCACACEHDAQRWINHKIAQHGLAIVGSDIYPALIMEQEVMVP